MGELRQRVIGTPKDASLPISISVMGSIANVHGRSPGAKMAIASQAD